MANIQDKLNNIKNALFGKDVRNSIHDGIDAINKEVESTTNRQEHLETTFDQLTINAGNSNAEIVDARVGENGKSYAKLGDRLDSVDSQLEHIENETDGVSVKNFGAKGDGVTDDTQAIQDAINYAINTNSKTIYIPSGNYLITSSLEINGSPICWDLTIKGSGKGIDGRGTCLKYTGSGNLLNIDLTYNAGVWRGIYFSNITFRGLDKINNGISLTFCQQAKFDNVYFTGFKSAVKLTGNSHYPNFINCNFTSNDIGIHILNKDEEGFVSGNANNGKIDNCFFTYCGNPLLQGDGSEWTIINTDFEGYNGAIVLTNSNRLINCRVERNNQDDNWIRIIGDNNQIDVNMHGVGISGGRVEFRILIIGNNNIIKGCFGYLITAINDLGDNNTFYINTNNGGYESQTTYVLRPNSFVFNNHNTNINKNQISSLGETGKNYNGEILHSVYNTKHKLVKLNNEDSYCRYTYGVDTYAGKKLYFTGCDIYIQNNNEFIINVMGTTIPFTHSNKWLSVINTSYKELTTSTVSIAKTHDLNGDCYFSVANAFVSDVHPPINFIKFADETKLSPSNFINNTIYAESLKVNILQLEELGNAVLNYKNRTLKYDTVLVDEVGNPIKYTTSTAGAIPSSTLIARVEGKGKGKFIDCFLSRENTSSNFNVTNKTAIGCDVTFANPAGTLGGSNLSEMEFFITTLG